MSSDIKGLLHVWSLQFFLSMGSVVSVAVALTVGLLLTHWLYLCARTIESKPTPASFPKALLRLSGFQALVAGVVLVPFVTISLFYFLSGLVWKLLPARLPASQLSAPPLIHAGPAFSDSASADRWFSIMSSLIIYLVALTAVIGGIIFFLLRRYAKSIGPQIEPLGFVKKLVKRYFDQSVLVGFILILIACPVILFFLYNVACLVMFIVPSAEQSLSKIAFANAEHIYVRSLEVIGSWFIVILFLPAWWLLARGLRLRSRYTIENPTMNVIFRRSVKLFAIGLFGFVGCTVTQLIAASLLKFTILVAFR
jgi:hypothetical protein